MDPQVQLRVYGLLCNISRPCQFLENTSNNERSSMHSNSHSIVTKSNNNKYNNNNHKQQQYYLVAIMRWLSLVDGDPGFKLMHLFFVYIITPNLGLFIIDSVQHSKGPCTQIVYTLALK